jgi:hypothetical protein
MPDLSGHDLDAELARVMGWALVVWPPPSVDLNLIRQVEVEIERRGLQDDYLREIGVLVYGDRWAEATQWTWAWAIRHAEPEVLAQAALRTLTGTRSEHGNN